jgi:hypothetical protein
VALFNQHHIKAFYLHQNQLVGYLNQRRRFIDLHNLETDMYQHHQQEDLTQCDVKLWFAREN